MSRFAKIFGRGSSESEKVEIDEGAMDILDLSDFGGSWEAAVGSLVEDRTVRKELL